MYELLKLKVNVSIFAPYFRQHGIDLEQTLREPASLFQARRLGYVNNNNEVTQVFRDKLYHDDFDSEFVELRKQVQRDFSSPEPPSILSELAFHLPRYIKRVDPSTDNVGVDSLVLKEFGGTLDSPTLSEVDGSQHKLGKNNRIIFRYIQFAQTTSYVWLPGKHWKQCILTKPGIYDVQDNVKKLNCIFEL